MFAIWGSSKCECLSVLNVKDAYHTNKLRNFQALLWYSTVFGSASYVYHRMPIGLSTSPAILQFYINAIQGSIPDRSKYLAIMDHQLLYSLKHSHLKYLDDLIKALLKNG